MSKKLELEEMHSHGDSRTRLDSNARGVIQATKSSNDDSEEELGDEHVVEQQDKRLTSSIEPLQSERSLDVDLREALLPKGEDERKEEGIHFRNSLSINIVDSTANTARARENTTLALRRTFLDRLGWNEEDIPGIDRSLLDKILSIEMTNKNMMRWATFENIPIRIMHYGLLHNKDLVDTENNHQHADPSSYVWIHNNSILLSSKYGIIKALCSDAFLQGLQFATAKGLHLTFSALLLYQMSALSKNVLDAYKASDENSTIALSSKFYNTPEYFSLFAAPVAYGFTRAIYTSYNLDQLTLAKIGDIQRELVNVSAVPEGIWNDYLRWALPFHPLNRGLETLTLSILWDGKLSVEERDEAFKIIKDVAVNRKGFSRAEGIQQLSKIAYGINAQDLIKLRGFDDNEDEGKILLKLFDIKIEALETLLKSENFGLDCGCLPLARLYQEYALWSIGHSPSFWKVSMPMGTFQAAHFFVQVYTLSIIIEAIIEYLNCPDKPGLTFAGYQSWSSDYSQECFDELVRQFNEIPGQPASMLASVIDQYYFPTGEYYLDLSNKAISSSVIIEIINGFTTGPILIGLDFSGNSFSGNRAYTELLQTIPQTVKSLKLKNNNIGANDNFDASVTVELSNGIGKLVWLTSLDLSDNFIGSWDSINPNGTIALGDGIGRLVQLTSLYLANNAVGDRDNINPTGTIALGNGIGKLVWLISLDLSTNLIGYCDSVNANGTIALGNGIGQVKQLKNLDLSSNFIEYGDNINPNGTIALGDGIGWLIQLISLDLTNNAVGYWDSENANGTIAIAKGIGKLVQLFSLDLSRNWIGYGNTATQNGVIGQGSGVEAITNSLSSLKVLKEFNLLPNSFLSSSTIEQFNIALNPNLPSIPVGIRNVSDVEKYFQSIPNNITSITLSGMLYPCDQLLITKLMYYLQQYQNLTFLDLSYNNIGGCNKVDSSVMMKLGELIWQLVSLTNLDLSTNLIGYWDSVNANGTIALGNGIGNLVQLTSLDLSNNFIGAEDFTNPTGTIALGNGIGKLVQLFSLDLSNNRIGYNSPTGEVAICSAFNTMQAGFRLKNLSVLDLSSNNIGSTDK